MLRVLQEWPLPRNSQQKLSPKITISVYITLSKWCRHKSIVCRHMHCSPESSKEKTSQSCRHSPVCVDTSLAFQKIVRRRKPVVLTQVQCVSTHPVLSSNSQIRRS
ncbi:hypothetical protein Taro_028655, partial [Colocasia esculenta]|nr:hypothetical protein [Colocasia esculenta]